MKKIAMLLGLVVLSGLLAACAAPRMIGPDRAKGWSKFIGQKVTDVDRVAYPSGDVPRNLIRLPNGAERIY